LRKNNFFLGSLATQELRRLIIDGHSVTDQEILFEEIGRLRGVVNASDGYLYIVLNQPDRSSGLSPAVSKQ
jgi:glucose/arabinose dehydrogenase